MTTVSSVNETLIDIRAVSRVFPKANGDDLVVLQNVDLLHDGTTTLLNDNAVIQDLLKNNRLVVD